MNRKNPIVLKNLVLFVIVVMILSIAVGSACNAQRRPGPTQPEPARPAPAQESRKSDMIADKIARMEEINSVTVVLAERTAWVGVDLAARLSGNLTDEVKNKITNLVKQEDSAITTVFVTADADTVTRLREIARDIANGRPVSGFIEELNEIGKRITPSAQ